MQRDHDDLRCDLKNAMLAIQQNMRKAKAYGAAVKMARAIMLHRPVNYGDANRMSLATHPERGLRWSCRDNQRRAK